MAAFANQNTSNPDFRDNPFAAPAVEDIAVYHEGKIGTGLKIAFSLQLLVLVGGIFAAYADVESILFSGPAYSIAGLITAAIGHFQKRRTIFLMGLSAPTLAVGIFLLIFLNRWSPQQAQTPVPIICTGYFIGIVIATMLMIHRSQTAATESPAEASVY